MQALDSGPPKTNPANAREEDLNQGSLDLKSSALKTRPRTFKNGTQTLPQVVTFVFFICFYLLTEGSGEGNDFTQLSWQMQLTGAKKVNFWSSRDEMNLLQHHKDK